MAWPLFPVEVPVAGVEPMRRPVVLVRPDDGQLTPAQRAFIATLGDCCAARIDACARPA